MQSLALQRARACRPARSRGCSVKVCAMSSNGASADVDAISKAIGAKIKAAASLLPAQKVNKVNVSIGKFVAAAGAKAANKSKVVPKAATK